MIRRFFKNQKGVSAVEFALIGPLFFMFLLGTLDLGYQTYLRNLLEGVMDDAARRAAVGNMTSTQVDTFIRTRVSRLLPKSERNNAPAFLIEKKAYFNFSNVGKPERITSDTNPVGTFNVGDCYEDANNNSTYDISGGTTGVGSADDIVFYTVTIYAPRLIPSQAFLSWDDHMTIKSTTLIRNQPFAAQASPPIRCTT